MNPKPRHTPNDDRIADGPMKSQREREAQRKWEREEKRRKLKKDRK